MLLSHRHMEQNACALFFLPFEWHDVLNAVFYRFRCVAAAFPWG